MEYSEICEKLKRHEKVLATRISNKQLFMLLHDKKTSIAENGKVYECNFLICDSCVSPVVFTSDALLKPQQSTYICHELVRSFESHTPFYVAIDDEYYEVVLDLIETRE